MAVGTTTGIAVDVATIEDVGNGVGVGVRAFLGLAVAVATAEAAGNGVGAGVDVGTSVGVGIAVVAVDGVGGGVGVETGVGDWIGSPAHPTALKITTRIRIANLPNLLLPTFGFLSGRTLMAFETESKQATDTICLHHR